MQPAAGTHERSDKYVGSHCSAASQCLPLFYNDITEIGKEEEDDDDDDDEGGKIICEGFAFQGRPQIALVYFISDAKVPNDLKELKI